MIVLGSSPGPTRIFAAAWETPSTTLSKIFFSTKSREPAQQHWPWLKKMAHGGAGNGGLEIGVVENDVRRFAAEFERNFLQVARGGVQDQLADFGGTGEGDLVDVRMRGERSAGRFAVAGDDVDDAVRECRLPESIRRGEAR